MNEQEFAELAAGHALNALSGDDQARYLAALRTHPEWGAVADADAETAAALADGVAPVHPDARLRELLLAQVNSTPQLSPHSVNAETDDARREPSPKPDERVARPRRMRILFALAACLALIVGIGYGAVALNDQLHRSPSAVALAEIQATGDAEQATVPLDNGGVATLHWSARLGAAVLVADGLAALDSTQAYELWFVRGDTPVSAGVFEPERGETIALLQGEIHAGDVIAVTVEQAGGSPNGVPTSEPIFAIPAS